MSADIKRFAEMRSQANAAVNENARSPNVQKRISAAGFATDPDVVDRLSRDSSGNVRRTIAERRNLDPAVIERLSKDHDASVKSAVILRQKLTPEQITRLAYDDDAMVRANLIKRSDLTPVARYELSSHKQHNIGAKVMETLKRYSPQDLGKFSDAIKASGVLEQMDPGQIERRNQAFADAGIALSFPAQREPQQKDTAVATLGKMPSGDIVKDAESSLSRLQEKSKQPGVER